MLLLITRNTDSIRVIEKLSCLSSHWVMISGVQWINLLIGKSIQRYRKAIPHFYPVISYWPSQRRKWAVNSGNSDAFHKGLNLKHICLETKIFSFICLIICLLLWNIVLFVDQTFGACKLFIFYSKILL